MEHQKDQELPVPVKVPSDYGSQQEPGEEAQEPSMQAESRPQSPLLGAIGGQLPESEPSVKFRHTLDDDFTEASDKRTRVLTQRGLEYQLTIKRKALKQAIRAWQQKADELQDILIEISKAEEVKSHRNEITQLFCEIQRVHDDLTTISPGDEHVIDSVCNEHRQIRSEINLKLRELLNEGSQSKSKGSRSHRSSHSSRSAKSMRLEEATKAAELAVRLKYYQKEADADKMKLEVDRMKLEREAEADKMKLEVDRMKLEREAEAERIKLEKDFEITKAKLRVIEEEEQSQGSPSQLPEEDPQERVQSFLDAMPTTDAMTPQPAPLSIPVQIVMASDALYQGAPDFNPIQSQTFVTSDTVSAPIVPTNYVTSTMPTATEQLTNVMTSRPTVTVPTSVSATTTSLVTSQSHAVTTVTSQFTRSSCQPFMLEPSFMSNRQQITQSIQTPLVSATTNYAQKLPSTLGQDVPQKSGEENTRNVTLLDAISKQNKLSRLPAPEPGVFSGDPLLYPSWKRAFTTLIDRCGIEPGDRIYYLQKYLGGAAKECIEGYLLLSSDMAYDEAQTLLEQRYGDPYIVASAYRKKLETYPKISPKDGQALRKYSDFLRQCLATMQSMEELRVLNDPHQNKEMCSKLPDWLRRNWARKVNDHRKKNGGFPSFLDFVGFISQESDIVCDPMTSADPNPKDTKEVKDKDKSTKKVKVKSLATQSKVKVSANKSPETETSEETPLQPKKESAPSEDKKRPRNRKCYFCNEEHFMSRCKEFRKKQAKDRVVYLEENGICLRCLCKGHTADVCRKTMITCVVCHGGHNSLTHTDSQRSDTQNSCGKEDGVSGTPGRNPLATSFVPSAPESSYVHSTSCNDE